MSQPTTYVRAFNFTNQQAVTPSTPLPADKLDLELNLVKTSLDETQANLRLVQRDDGALRNGSVGFDQFKAEVKTGFNPPSPWLTVTNYIARDTVFIDAAFYLCEVSHISGVFATDLVAGKWLLIADLSSIPTGLPAVPTTLNYLRRNASNSAYEDRTPEQVLTDIGGEKEIHAATAKTVPVDADELGLWDSVGSVFKKLTFANLKATVLAALGVTIAALTGKTTPVDADTLVLSDSAASGAGKSLTWANVKATLLSSTFLWAGGAQSISADQQAQARTNIGMEFGYPLFHAVDEKTNGTAGGTSSAGTNVRALNTVRTNEISGASLNSNIVTLPEGVYEIAASAKAFQAGRTVLYIGPGALSTVLLSEDGVYINSTGDETVASLHGRITVPPGGGTYRLLHIFGSGLAAQGFGVECNYGVPEIYAHFKAWKLK